MANFQPYQSGLTEAFNVSGASQALLAQQKATGAEMLAQVERFNQTRMAMDEARAKVSAVLGEYGTDDKGKPDVSAPKYVHDAYNAVNKEGGVANMSATQLNSVLTGYQTGVETTQTKLKDLTARNAIKQMEEQQRIEEAYQKTQAERDAIAKTEKISKTTRGVESKTYDVTNPTGLFDFLADQSKAIANQKPGKGVRKDADVSATNAPGWTIKTHEDLVKSLKDASQKTNNEERAKREEIIFRQNESRKLPAINRNIESLTSDIAAIDRSIASARFAFENPSDSNEQLFTIGAGMPGAYTPPKDRWFRGGEPQKKSEEEKTQTLELFNNVINEANQRKDKAISELLKFKTEKNLLENRISTSKGGPLVPSVYAATKTEPTLATLTQAKYETIQEEKIREQVDIANEEYSIITNHLKASGNVPYSWNKSTYMQLKGIPNIQQTEIPGVGMYVSVNGGQGQIIQSKQQSIGDLTAIRDATILAQQRNLGSGTELVEGSGYLFSGEIRSNDVKDVNRIRSEIKTNVLAVQSIDTLLRIAEDATLLQKLTPNEITGIAGLIKNSIEAAKRTEIGGSGAWSEQDQKRMDQIVVDPTSILNTIWGRETIAKLKQFKQNTLDSMKGSGSVYGYRMTGSPQDSRRAEMSIQRARIVYSTAISSGKTEQEATELAKNSYLTSNR